uniref:Uncharacterized protein n=1 Tax=Panagrolaimus sp. PS1159 TaxID=55785 RepID=A0AC35FGY2_9BILA
MDSGYDADLSDNEEFCDVSRHGTGSGNPRSGPVPGLLFTGAGRVGPGAKKVVPMPCLDLRPKKHQLKPKSFFNIPRICEYFNSDEILRHYVINGPVIHSSGSVTPQPVESNTNCSTTSTTTSNTSIDKSNKIGKKRKRASCNDKTVDKNGNHDDDDHNDQYSPKNRRYNCVPYFWFSNCVTVEIESEL